MTEAELCAAYLETVPPEWTAYAETGGWDILLVHSSGVQVGIEAKRILNAKALAQALDLWTKDAGVVGPDYRAILVERSSPDMARIAAALGVGVLTLCAMRRGRRRRVTALPAVGRSHARRRTDWVDHWPLRRCALPAYVPDVPAGVAAPVRLTEWKIKAAKVVIIVERTGQVSAADFRVLGLAMSTWSQRGWLIKGERRGIWVPGPHWPGPRFRAQHTEAMARIETDWPRWSPRVLKDRDGEDALQAA